MRTQRLGHRSPVNDHFRPSHQVDPLPAPSGLTQRAILVRSTAHKSRLRSMRKVGLLGAERVDVGGTMVDHVHTFPIEVEVKSL